MRPPIVTSSLWLMALLFFFALAQLTAQPIAEPIDQPALTSNQDDGSCTLMAREAKDCSVCCALGGFNKFDSRGFQAGKGCHCFMDEKEMAANTNSNKARRP